MRLAVQEARLDAAVAPLLEQGIEVSTEVEWDKDWYHAVVRASMRAHAHVVFKSSYRHNSSQRVLNKTSDFTLIKWPPFSMNSTQLVRSINLLATSSDMQ